MSLILIFLSCFSLVILYSTIQFHSTLFFVETTWSPRVQFACCYVLSPNGCFYTPNILNLSCRPKINTILQVINSRLRCSLHCMDSNMLGITKFFFLLQEFSSYLPNKCWISISMSDNLTILLDIDNYWVDLVFVSFLFNKFRIVSLLSIDITV